jgi:type IX secretion system PorP/SprF family membrane protein
VKRLALIIVAIGLITWVKGQDPQFTQFYANQLYLAPSFAGATEQNRLTAAYRNQWPEIVSGVFVTYSFSYDHFFENFNSGVGVLFTRDVAGTGNLGTTNAGIQYSYDIKVTEEFHLRPGIHFNYTHQGIDFENLTWNDQLLSGSENSLEADPGQGTNDVDFAVSLLGYGERWWAGFTVDHLLRPDYGLYNNEYRLPMKFSVFGGYQIIKFARLVNPIDESVSIAAYFRTQGDYYQMDIGLYWLKTPIMVGLWYRGIPFLSGNEDDPYRKDPRGDALAILVGYKAQNPAIRVGYSYDFTISRLVSSTGGAHELVVTYEFTTKRRHKHNRMVPCPQF